MATHDGLERGFDSRDGMDGAGEFRENGMHGDGMHAYDSRGQETGNASGYSANENRNDANEASDWHIRNEEKMHDEELSRSRGMQEYWKRLSERVANVGRQINRRINRTLDDSLGAQGMEPNISNSRVNEVSDRHDRMRGSDNNPKPHRRIE